MRPGTLRPTKIPSRARRTTSSKGWSDGLARGRHLDPAPRPPAGRPHALRVPPLARLLGRRPSLLLLLSPHPRHHLRAGSPAVRLLGALLETALAGPPPRGPQHLLSPPLAVRGPAPPDRFRLPPGGIDLAGRHRDRLRDRIGLGRLGRRPPDQAHCSPASPAELEPLPPRGVVLRPEEPEAPAIDAHPRRLHCTLHRRLSHPEQHDRLLDLRVPGGRRRGEAAPPGGQDPEGDPQEVRHQSLQQHPLQSPAHRRHQAAAPRRNRPPLQGRPGRGQGRGILGGHEPGQGALHPPQVQRR